MSETCKRGHTIAEVGRYKHGGCRACVALRNKLAWAQNKEQAQERYRAYHELNPEQRSRRWREWRYGLTGDDFEALVEVQEGVCGICQTEPPEGKGLVVDHNHDTGEVRGLLCAVCNSGIGMLKDNADLLRRAVAWVETES